MKRTALACCALAFTLALASPAPAQTMSPSELTNRVLHRRAVEAVIWGMPAVNYDLMLQEMLTKTPGKVNQVIYWGRPLDWRNQTLTPNPDTLYFMAFFNTKDVGPIVIEVPAGGRRRLPQRQHRQRLAGAARGCGTARGRQGQGHQVRDAAARLLGENPRRLCRTAAGYIRQLRAVPLEPREPQRCRCREIRGLRQADQDLSALPGVQSAAHGVHRRQGRALRLDHSLRRKLLRGAQPDRAGRTVARSRSRHDRPPEIARHREGRALRSHRRDQAVARRRYW